MIADFFRSFCSTKAEIGVNMISGKGIDIVSLHSPRTAEDHHAKHRGHNGRESVKAIFLDERHLSNFEG
jgi:hypothetical protein